MSVELGLTLPQFGASAGEAARIGQFAADAQAAGAASLWVGDRLLAPRNPQVAYPGSDTVPVEFRRALDPFAVLTAAAVTTTTATLGTSVLISPLYAPALLARSLATLAGLSQGRLLAGLGLGWAPEEYTAAGVGAGDRGARLDELLDSLDALWSGRGEGLDGRFWTTPASWVETPSPRVPLYAAAFSGPALRRVGRRLDGWLPVARLTGSAVQDAEQSVDGLLAMRATIDDAAVAAGRDPAGIPTVVRVNLTADVERAELAEAVALLADRTGFDHFFIDPMYRDRSLEERLATFDHVRGALPRG